MSKKIQNLISNDITQTNNKKIIKKKSLQNTKQMKTQKSKINITNNITIDQDIQSILSQNDLILSAITKNEGLLKRLVFD